MRGVRPNETRRANFLLTLAKGGVLSTWSQCIGDIEVFKITLVDIGCHSLVERFPMSCHSLVNCL